MNPTKIFHSGLDIALKRITYDLCGNKFFRKGWGNDFQQVSQKFNLLNQRPQELRSTVRSLWDNDGYRAEIKVIKEEKGNNLTVMDGYFKSPVHEHLPNESINSHFRLVLPKNHNKNTPIVCILPATGDHSYFRRYQFLSKPLAKLGVGSALPVIPYYGIRKPKHQFRSYFLHASDMITLGAAIVTESHLLFSHLQKEYGFNKFGITGISMGGLMSAYSACLIDYPITLISFMSPISCYTYFKNNMVDLNALSVDTKHKIEDLINMTDLRNLPPPIGNTVFVGGYYDEYIHADEIRSLQEIWTQRNIKSNMEFKFLPIGHVMSVAYTSQVFTNIIHKSLFNTKSYNSFDQSWFDNHRMDPV